MTDTSHLNALEYRLFNEEGALAAATNPKEIELRTVWVEQVKREIESEKKFLGFEAIDESEELDLDELLAALSE